MPSAVSHVAAQLSGTMTGIYSNIHIPFAGYLLNYSTSGTLTNIGSAQPARFNLARPSGRAGRAAGQFVVRNAGGSMTMNLHSSATTGAYSYNIIRETGVDGAYKGGTGLVTIAQTPTYSYPYFVSGQGTMTFTSS